MSRIAWLYITGVLFMGVALSVVSLIGVTFSWAELATFGLLTFLATISQLFEAKHGKQSFYPHFVFFMASLLTLQPFLFILVVIIPHLVEWGKERLSSSDYLKAWYIQPFNIVVHICSGVAAKLIYDLLASTTSLSTVITPVIASTAAVVTYVLINHLMVGMALVLARGISWKQSGTLEIECLVPDIILSYLGYIVYELWKVNPWLVLPALSPLVLMYRALMVPQLKQEAQTDGKTGLWNARHFTALFTTEMERAKRFDRPLTVIMADLDLLRNINNTYGHLAGDTVLSGIGQIIRENVREYDIAGRFGGEEFAIVLPETGPVEAQALAERLRAAVEVATFEVGTAVEPIGVTMSLGVACCPWDATTLTDLIHEADVAVYQAKLRGRNCVVCATEVPHSVKLDHTPNNERVSAPYNVVFTPRPIPARAQVANAQATSENAVTSTTETVTAHTGIPRMASSTTLMPAAASVVAEQTSDTQVHPYAPIVQEPEIAVAEPPLAPPTEPGRVYPKWMFNAFVVVIITSGLLLTLLGVLQNQRIEWAAVALLTAFAIGAELLQINVYGDNTVSVSVALAFAAALLGGITGAACVSAAIALAHYIQMKPVLYKTGVNWSAHLLAGAAPALMFGALNVKLTVPNVPVLIIPIVVAGLAYYAIDTGIIALAITISRGGSILSTWRDQFRWLVNHYLVLCGMGAFLGIAYMALGPMGILVFMLPVVMMRYSQKQYVDRTQQSMMELKRMNQELTTANRAVVSANKVMEQLNEELFLTLSKIIDARDPYVGGHASKVSDYATAIAVELQLPFERMEPLRQAGFLHDIGKIGISEQVLHKPSRLTPEEYEYIKTHASLGGEFLEMCGALRHLAPFVRHHHEWWDGSGYPDKLRGEEIPLEARILAVCDAAEAMASDRPYRKGMSLNEVIAEIRRCAGTQFDPGVAEAFSKIAERERDRLVVNSAHEVLRRQTYNGHVGHTVDGSMIDKHAQPIAVAASMSN